MREEAFYWEADVLARRLVSNPLNQQVIRDEEYVFDPEQAFRPVARVRREAEVVVERYAVDARGGAAALFDGTGALAWRAPFRPLGPDAPDDDQPILLAG